MGFSAILKYDYQPGILKIKPKYKYCYFWMPPFKPNLNICRAVDLNFIWICLSGKYLAGAVRYRIHNWKIVGSNSASLTLSF